MNLKALGVAVLVMLFICSCYFLMGLGAYLAVFLEHWILGLSISFLGVGTLLTAMIYSFLQEHS